MANIDAPKGLQPYQPASGGVYTGGTNDYYIPASYGTALFIGDPVVKTGTSNTAEVKAVGGTYEPGTLQEINKATAGQGNAITGVIVGFRALEDDSKTYNTASTERIAIVMDDPSTRFVIQGDSATAYAATMAGANCELVYTHSGSTSTGLSGAEADLSTIGASDATSQLKLLALVNDPSNEIGTHAKIIVKINNHTEAPNTAGI